MTTEQKAKAYNEALEWMRKVYPTLTGADKEDAECYFPELKESEDERIRKELYAVINDLVLPDEQKERFNAWLEKQKEPENVSTSTMIPSWWTEEPSLQKEQKPANEPKFKVGDWIIFAENHNSVYQVERIDKYRYYLRHYLGGTLSAHFDNELVRQWTIQDAKPGDVLVCIGKYGQEIGIVKEYVGKYGGCDKCFETYCFVDWEGIFRTGEYMGSKEIHPATKEQRNTLMKAMADNGYTFDFENKNLNKKEQKPITINQDEKEFLADEITAFLCNYDKEFDGEDPVPSEVAEHFYLLGKQAQKPVEWSDTDNIGWDEAFACVTRAEKAAKNEEELQNAVTAEKWLKEIKFKYCVHPVNQEWSEEDENKLNHILEIVHIASGSEASVDEKEELESFLKSLRPQPHKETYQAAKHDLATEFMNYLDNNKPEGKMCLSNGECEDIDKAFKENDWAKIIRYAEKYQIQQKPEVKHKGWVARDSEHDSYLGLGLVLFKEKPIRSGDCWIGIIDSQLPWKSFPDLKWEDEPLEVEVEIIIRKK